jgi:hypothetical protein
VTWDKKSNKWRAECKSNYLGCHTTEEDAAQVYSKYLKDGIDPVVRRVGRTSHFAR